MIRQLDDVRKRDGDVKDLAVELAEELLLRLMTFDLEGGLPLTADEAEALGEVRRYIDDVFTEQLAITRRIAQSRSRAGRSKVPRGIAKTS